MDAYVFDVSATPDDAYRFARGEELVFPAGRRSKLERPLDFAAVTEHAEYLGELSLCSRPESPVYGHRRCRMLRGQEIDPDNPLSEFGARMGAVTPAGITAPGRSEELCGEDARLCLEAMDSVWAEIRAANERFYDQSAACSFTTFNAYEYSATPNYTKVHRNVVFRSDAVPERPVAWVDEPSARGLWEKLRDGCVEAGTGCDVLTIPHNSNMSGGQMFTVEGRDDPLEEQVANAQLRARLEPLVEISQIKGDSECRNGMWKIVGESDEHCEFEKLYPELADCEDGTGEGTMIGRGCTSRLDFVRYALVEGLREAERIGVNPYKLGIIASTDAHNANPGDVNERSFIGWQGTSDASPQLRLAPSSSVTGVRSNPGGLVGVWATENSREALFDAMQRRETFGTSGPRIVPRLFGGWSFDPELCTDAGWVARADAAGVPMGADLPPRADGAHAPTFIVSALADPGTPGMPGTPLQRIQIVKGWAGDAGEIHQQVFEVAGTQESSATVDLATCAPRGTGHAALCGVWRDPEFAPSQAAVYYARVLENPSCRWNTLQCNALQPSERPASCSDPSVPRTIQERAWTSPIWYAPSGG
jgi:hypothetical protein